MAAQSTSPNTLLYETKTIVASNVTVENCMKLFLLSSQINCEDLKKKCFRFIQINCPETVLHNKNTITDFPIDVFRKLLSDRSLRNVSEFALWEIIVEWIEHNDERMMYVPELLNLLAKKEIDENLARAILEHKIVTSNPLYVSFDRSDPRSSLQSNLEILLHFLTLHSKSDIASMNYRIPSRLYVVAKRLQVGCTEIYVTYDEHFDMWRKIYTVNFVCSKIVCVQQKIHLFGYNQDNFYTLDLRDNSLRKLDLNNVLYLFYAFKHHNKLHIFAKHRTDDRYLQVLIDPHNNHSKSCNHWNDVGPFPTSKFIIDGCVAAMSSKIYFVGIIENDWNRMTCLVNNPGDPEEILCKAWPELPAPNIYRRFFNLAALNGKLFVIGGKSTAGLFIRDVEVFDTVTGEWRVTTPSFPSDISYLKATVLNGNLYVYETFFGPVQQRNAFIWDESSNKFNELPESRFLTLHAYRFSEVEEEETIKSIWKDGPSTNSAFQQSDFHKYAHLLHL